MNKELIILFDLSGVLVELGGMPDFVKWTGMSTDDIGSQWLKSESVRSFERGHSSFEAFHAHFVKEWNVSISSKELFEAFESWVKSAIPGAIDLLSELSDKYTLACLTNTNPVQWPVVQRTIETHKYFKFQFASHEVGKIKPDSDAYEHVIDTLGVPAKNIIFLDDSLINVEAASEMGMKAFHVKGAIAARNALIANALL